MTEMTTNTEKKYDVYGIGNPLIDVLTKVNDNLINTLQMDKGIMQLIDKERRKEILSNIPTPTLVPGGSCANTMVAMADFGINVVYSGSISDDEFGNKFELELKKLGVTSNLTRKTLPTGSSIILISEDAERTQNTYLGACQEYSKEDIDEEKLKQSKILYFTGFMWDTLSQKEAILRAIDIAKENDVKIFFDVADPFAVNRNKEDFLNLIKNDVDFVFANEEEAKALMGKEDVFDAISDLMEIIPKGAVKLGAQGSVVFENGLITNVPVFEVNAQDTTGAGDSYAAGLIYGLVKGYELERAGKIGSYVSSRVVELIGPRLESSLKGIVDDIE
jgi:sugar/nucleoside kinase (ribokinase family)